MKILFFQLCGNFPHPMYIYNFGCHTTTTSSASKPLQGYHPTAFLLQNFHGILYCRTNSTSVTKVSICQGRMKVCKAILVIFVE